MPCLQQLYKRYRADRQLAQVSFMNAADVCVFWGNLLKALHIAPEGG